MTTGIFILDLGDAGISLCQSLPTDPSPKANIKIPVVINLNNI
jgi:hypothetical protein